MSNFSLPIFVNDAAQDCLSYSLSMSKLKSFKFSLKWHQEQISNSICLIFYVIGIPAFQLLVMCKNRKNLYKDEAKDPVVNKLLTAKYGALYLNYRPAMYFTDIVDNFRRLLLTGGLIFVGEDSVVQVYLGILLCMFWLAYVIAFDSSI